MQFFVLAGSKTVTLFPPGQAARLYPATQRLGTHYCLLPPAALHASSAEVHLTLISIPARYLHLGPFTPPPSPALPNVLHCIVPHCAACALEHCNVHNPCAFHLSGPLKHCL